MAYNYNKNDKQVKIKGKKDDKKSYSSIIKMAFTENSAIPIETYHNKKTSKVIIIEFNN